MRNLFFLTGVCFAFVLSSCGGSGGGGNGGSSTSNSISSCNKQLVFAESPVVDESSNLTQSPNINWNPLETDCSSLYYEVAISDNAIDANVVSWIYAGNVTDYKIRFVLLERSKPYYVLLRALSNGDVKSNVVASEAWIVSAPDLTVEFPQENQTFNGSTSFEEFPIQGQCSEANQYIGVRVDDELVSTRQVLWCDGSEFTLSVDLSDYEDGNINLQLETRDIYGQVIFSQSVNFIKETKKPELKKIIRGSDPGGSPTVNRQVKFKLIFDEDITGLAMEDFAINYLQGDLVGQITEITGGGEVWQVTIDINSGLGVLGLSFNDANQSIKDFAGNNLDNTTATSSEDWEIIEDAPPEMLSINALSDDDIPTTNQSTLVFVAAFNKKVFNVSASDFSVEKEGGITSNPIIDSVETSPDGTSFNVAVSNVVGTFGQLKLNFNDVDNNIVDIDNNPLTSSSFVNGQYWIIDNFINKPTNIKMSSDFIYGELPLDSPLLFWSFPDDDIEQVEVALGTNPDSEIDNFVPWEEADSLSSHRIKFLTGIGECVSYYPSIRLKDKSGNISAPLTDRGGFIWDNSAPQFNGDIVILEQSNSINESPRFQWPEAEDLCGISYYDVAVGTTPGGSDIIDYTRIPVNVNVFEYQITHLVDGFDMQLELGQNYYLSIVATDISNKISSFIISNPWSVSP